MLEKIQEAKKVLKNSGYYSKNLWHEEDVLAYSEKILSSEECQDILHHVLSNPHLVETINMMIEEEIERRLKSKV